jgi:hypothetical protein
MPFIKCKKCGNQFENKLNSCPFCDENKKSPKSKSLTVIFIIVGILCVVGVFNAPDEGLFRYLWSGGHSQLESKSSIKNESTKAVSSVYNIDIRKATTSRDLKAADLAWHAKNTYGWDCEEVVSKTGMNSDGYFYIECSSGLKLRVYPRQGQHPRVTNENGDYK